MVWVQIQVVMIIIYAVNNLAATDVTTDTPTNNFATGNPLIHIAGGNI